MLLNLYKQEPSQKKVYDFLLQDFTQAKIKTMASKNALALISKKNYFLSCAFFLMAGYLKDALQVAIDRIQDPVLAIMMIRLMDEEDSKTLKDAYMKHFIERGEKQGDPYLQNIGRWQRKEFLKSVNLFQVDNTKQSNIQHILKHDQTEFNLFFSFKLEEEKSKSLDESQNFIPLPAHYDYFVLDFIRVLKKHTNVKRDMQKTWKQNSMGGGDSIFDDFFGGSASKQEDKKDDPEEEKKLIIDESKILEVVTFEASQRGYSLVSLITMTENKEYLEKMNSKYKSLSAQSLITDVIQSLMSSESYQQVQNLGHIIAYLADKMDLKEKDIRQFVGKQLKHIDNLNLIISYLIQEGKEGVMYKVEQEALKQMNFIHSLADFPFITEGIYTDKRGFNVLKMVNFLENLVESYMQVDFQEHAKDQIQQKEDNQLLSRVSMTYVDFENDEENYKITVDEQKGNFDLKKLRTTLIIYVSLIQLCYISRKFSLVKALLTDLRSIMDYNTKQKNGSQSDGISLQSLKTKIQKFKYQLQKPDKEDEEQEEIGYQKVGFLKPSKEDEELARKKNKMHQFMVLWMRYIICHHVLSVIKQQYDKTQIKELIDLRPSIIQTRPLTEAIEIIMNPRLVSGELLKKFGNMQRTLENVCTYYFENFLNLQERSNILEELKKLASIGFTKAETEHLNLIPLFGNENKFAEFAALLDFNGFINHLKDHELSLVYHTNNDYSHQTVQRVQDLYESGIEIFRMKGETINGFAFDKCDMDLVALAALNKGIREVPVKKGLIYRSRLNKGHQVLDEECANWHDCLKRYDKVEKEHRDVKLAHEPIIAVVDKLYAYKTVNYTKKPRRSRGTLFLDYEMSPPDIWSGGRSNLDLTHEDYTGTIESHPYLPLYLSGNQKGMLCLWGFNQQDDKSLDQWITDGSDSKNINTKKAAIKKIVFSNYGDKIISSNMDGSVFMHRFDNYETSKTMPIFNLAKSKEQKFNDFDLLNNDSIVALTSLKPKHIWMYDTLISQKGGLIMESQVGGNLMQPNRSRSQILVFNEKPGQLNILDLKMNKLVANISLHNDEVTAVTMNETENALVVGFRDGIVKVFNADRDYEIRESFLAFSQIGNKKGTVTDVKIHPNNGALFASSLTGYFKVLRSKI